MVCWHFRLGTASLCPITAQMQILHSLAIHLLYLLGFLFQVNFYCKLYSVFIYFASYSVSKILRWHSFDIWGKWWRIIIFVCSLVPVSFHVKSNAHHLTTSLSWVPWHKPTLFLKGTLMCSPTGNTVKCTFLSVWKWLMAKCSMLQLGTSCCLDKQLHGKGTKLLPLGEYFVALAWGVVDTLTIMGHCSIMIYIVYALCSYSGYSTYN